MSSRQRRHVLVGLLGMLAGILVVGSLLVIAGWSGGGLDGLAGPLVAALIALSIHRFAPRRAAEPDRE